MRRRLGRPARTLSGVGGKVRTGHSTRHVHGLRRRLASRRSRSDVFSERSGTWLNSATSQSSASTALSSSSITAARSLDDARKPVWSVSPLPSMRGSENVLLVEDDEIVRKMVTGILTADGYKVVSARSFGSLGARDLRPARGMQLLIADLSGEGDKFARRLQRTHPGLRVLCTSHHASSPPLAWLPAERQARIAKPYALGDLLRAVRKLLDAA